MEDNELFDDTDAGIWIGGKNSPISPRTLQRWRHEGVGPKWVKVGRLVRYWKSDLLAYLRSRERRSTSSGG